MVQQAPCNMIKCDHFHFCSTDSSVASFSAASPCKHIIIHPASPWIGSPQRVGKFVAKSHLDIEGNVIQIGQYTATQADSQTPGVPIEEGRALNGSYLQLFVCQITD